MAESETAPDLTDDSCDDCGFDASTMSRSELIDVVAGAADGVDSLLAGLDARTLARRPDPETWSPLEYVEHIREVFAHSRLICEQAINGPEGPYDGDFPPGLSPEPAVLDRREVLASLRAEATRNEQLFSALSESDWDRASLLMEHRWTLRFAVTHLAHELLHHGADIARATDPPA